MADDKKKQEEKAKKHAHGEGPVTDAKAHAETKKGGGGGKKRGKDQKAPATIQAAQGKAAARGEHPARLGLAYKDQIIPALMKEFGYKNPMQVPRVEKVVVNMGLGEAITNNKLIEQAKERMYEFLDRLLSTALPRVRDFKGVSAKSFDGRGNYTLGIKEQIIFPEINYDRIEKIKGMNITIVTTARSDEEGRALLRYFGMPFRTA